MNHSTHHTEFLAGLRAGIPIMIGYLPVGFAYAILAGHAGFTTMQTVLMSLTVFAGASQMMAVGMIAEGATLAAIIIATFILNFRHFIMSTCIYNHMKDGPLSLRMLTSFGVTDESFAVFTTGNKEHTSVYYYGGLVSSTYLAWVGGSALGAAASGFLPPLLSASLGIALYAMFIGLLTPNLIHRSRLVLLVILTAALNTLLNRWMDPSWALILATLIGAAAGVFLVDDDKDDKEEKEAAHE